MIPSRTCPFSSLGSGFGVLLLFLLILVFCFVFCFQSSPSVHVAAKMIPRYFTRIYLIAYALKRTGSVSFNKNPVKISQRADWLQIHLPRYKPITMPRKCQNHWTGPDLFPSLKLRLASTWTTQPERRKEIISWRKFRILLSKKWSICLLGKHNICPLHTLNSSWRMGPNIWWLR